MGDIIFITLETEDGRYIFSFSTFFILFLKGFTNVNRRYTTLDENPDTQNRQKFRKP